MKPSPTVVLLALALLPLPLSAQRPTRAIRRDLPITNMIERAYAAGTRDSTGRPGAKYWQPRVDYRIDAQFDPATSRITAKQTTTIHNNSPVRMDTVVLRLDQNIFAPGAQRVTPVPELTEGFQFSRVVLNGTSTQLNTNATSVRIPLATGIPAGGTGTLEFEYTVRIARTVSRGLRHGAWGDSLVQAAQWYPRVAVYDDLRGWDTDPYLGGSEFYNNFGNFDVRIDLPAGWLVGATGLLQNPTEVLTPTALERLSRMQQSDEVVTVVSADERGPGKATLAGDRLVWHFTADNVNDFAWGASSVYVWQAQRVAIPGAGTIPSHIFFARSRAQAFATAPQVAKHALQFYSKLWMPYAFPQMTTVDGPENGMEYPMLVMSGVGALDHEIGHEWWPMMVSNNETWWGFMDEGFNRYMNNLSRADAAGRAAVIDSAGQRYGQVSGNEQEATLIWDENYAGPLYRFAAYEKTPLMLSMLGGIVGDSAVQRAQSVYAKTWAFKHPSPWDYAFLMSRELKQDLDWFWYYWLFTTERVDGSIRNVKTTGAKTTVTVYQAGQMPSPVVLRVDFAADGPAVKLPQNGRMLNATSAVVTYPVDVWFGGSRTFDAVLDFGGRKIEKITLDPNARFPDRDPKDNIWPR